MLGLIKLEHTAVVHLNGTHLPNDKLTRHFTSRECPYSGVFPFQIIRSRNRKKPRGSPLRKIYDHCTVAMSKGKVHFCVYNVARLSSEYSFVLGNHYFRTMELLLMFQKCCLSCTNSKRRYVQHMTVACMVMCLTFESILLVSDK